VEPANALRPEAPGAPIPRDYAWLALRAALVAAALLLTYYVANPGGKFFYQGF
jgi:hypothetical protein